MSKRSYNQYCAVARALDVIGERWTLLLVRELLLGPKRYGDLLAANSGIGTNLLADRLKEMEGQGLIERVTLPPPASSTVYRLTSSGAELEPVVRAIGRWGGRFMDKRGPGQQLSLGAYFVAIREWFRPERATGLYEAYEFRVDGRVFEIRVDGGTCATSEGSASGAVAVFGMSLETLDQLFRGEIPADRAIAEGRVKVDGDREALARFQAIFQFPAASTA